MAVKMDYPRLAHLTFGPGLELTRVSTYGVPLATFE
jgi:hypothetical protein